MSIKRVLGEVSPKVLIIPNQLISKRELIRPLILLKIRKDLLGRLGHRLPKLNRPLSIVWRGVLRDSVITISPLLGLLVKEISEVFYFTHLLTGASVRDRLVKSLVKSSLSLKA